MEDIKRVALTLPPKVDTSPLPEATDLTQAAIGPPRKLRTISPPRPAVATVVAVASVAAEAVQLPINPAKAVQLPRNLASAAAPMVATATVAARAVATVDVAATAT